MGTLVPPITTYNIDIETPTPTIPIINVVSVGDSFKLDAFKVGNLGTTNQILKGNGINETPIWVEDADAINNNKQGSIFLTEGIHTINFELPYYTDLNYIPRVEGFDFTTEEEVQVKIIRNSKTISSFDVYVTADCVVEWTVTKY
jgi:hypothetical protein